MTEVIIPCSNGSSADGDEPLGMTEVGGFGKTKFVFACNFCPNSPKKGEKKNHSDSFYWLSIYEK